MARGITNNNAIYKKIYTVIYHCSIYGQLQGY